MEKWQWIERLNPRKKKRGLKRRGNRRRHRMSKTYIVKNTFVGTKDKEDIKVMELPNKDVLVIVGAYYYLENRYETPESPMTFEARVDPNDKDAIKEMLRKLKKT